VETEALAKWKFAMFSGKFATRYTLQQPQCGPVKDRWGMCSRQRHERDMHQKPHSPIVPITVTGCTLTLTGRLERCGSCSTSQRGSTSVLSE
jgi:hypothetical protein